MPGTIQVSVLEFKGLPSTSPSIILKVALGKKEYQTSDVRDFSFPLTSLRDNLVVTIQDAEGKEITHAVVQTMSIVEKVLWDDIFHLDGGGHLHLQLQFILSDEERNRIRSMREAAVKKKQASKQSEIASSGTDSVMSSLQAEQIVSDSPRTVPRVVSLEDASMQVGLLSNCDILYEGSQSNYGKQRETILEQEIPKAKYEREGAFAASRFLGIEEHFVETHERPYSMLEIQSSYPNTHVKPVSSQEASSKLEYTPEVSVKSTSVSPEEDHVDKPEQQGPLEKTPSNVRKLLSAFEGTLAQDLKSLVKPSAVKPEEKKVGKGGYLKDSDPAESISGRQKKPFVPGDLKSTKKGGEKIDSDRVSVDNIMSMATNRLKQSTSAVIESRRKGSSSTEWAKSSLALETSSIANSACGSGRKFDDSSGRSYSFGLSTERQDSGGTSYVEGRSKNGSDEISLQVASSGKSKYLDYREAELFHFEKSGMWIFPNDSNHLCITTAGKRVMNLLRSHNTEAESHQKKKSGFVSGHVDKHGTENEKKDCNKVQNQRKSRSESSSGDASGGFVAQAIKVAVVVGFGILVFLTRRREPRKSKKDTETDYLFLETPLYTAERILTEEKMDCQ